MDEITKLRQALAEAERRREEEQRRREEAEDRALEEQRRRQRAEEASRTSQLQIPEPYLEACHSLSLAMEVITDRSLTTQGNTTNPAGRHFPQRIVPWNDFPAMQEEIWNLLSEPSFTSQPTFPSQHQVDYVRSLISPITSEHGLQYFSVPEATVGDPSLAPTPEVRTPHHSTKGVKGKGNRADMFCIQRTPDGAKVPIIAIEYKAPHKLSQDEVVTGLASEIQPARDVINKEAEGFVFAAKALAAAVVTQCFSYMVGRGIKHGYVSTGQTFIFLYIPDDPTMVFYNVCVPNLDVLDNDENRLHRTAVAQVFAFILQAVRTQPPPQSWHDTAKCLDTWAVEFDDVLSKIPVTVRKAKERASPYRPQQWRGFTRSPIRTCSRCQGPDIKRNLRDGDDGDDTPPSPTPGGSSRLGRNAATPSTSSRASKGGRRGGQHRGKATRLGIQDRPYCTHQCLLGLAYGGPIDKACPNAGTHGSRHIGRDEFHRLLHIQLAGDRGPDADCTPLYISGSIGSLFKVRMSTYGYTLVAKGVETANLGRMQHENEVYNQLRTLQGKHVPVCLGLMDLSLPLYCDGGVFKHFLLLSWAGRPLSKCIDRVDKATASGAITATFRALHRLHILHGDAEPRNVLYDPTNGSLLVVDFERAAFRGSQPLGLTRPNGKSRKRKRGLKQKDDFTLELRSVVERISGCFDDSGHHGAVDV